MEDTGKTTVLKFEGFVFALSILAFIVMYYFKYIDKYLLGTLILAMSACLFSINVNLQKEKGDIKMMKINAVISFLFFFAALGLGIYFFAAGLMTI